MLGTSLTLMRLAARPFLTADGMSAAMLKRGLKRSPKTITAFERGQLKHPDKEFVALWSELVGQPEERVWSELRKVQRQRRTSAGPFVPRSLSPAPRERLVKSY